MLAGAIRTAPELGGMPDEILSDERLEARAYTIGPLLLCLVWQSEHIGGSEADLALDSRRPVRQRLLADDFDERFRHYNVAARGPLSC
jgi:cytochrome c-type biogenesis protein CcmH/NrfF